MKDQNTNTILNSLAEAVVTIDKNFKITFINEAAKKITGFKKDEIVGMYCKHFFESDFCEINCPIVNVIKSGKSIYDRETELKCDSETTIPIKLNAAVLKDESGIPIGGVITFRDISQLKKMENILDANYVFHNIVSRNKQMKEIFNLIIDIADTDIPILITGETGTGKELIANAIQNVSKRKDKPYLKINCSIIPENLIVSELFGHVKGAFTDARQDRTGRFEYADKGTIFLDEIGDLPISVQPQLLRFLQDGTYERLGDTVTKKSDVRIISATNINLEEAITNGTFRKDLFYRLNVVNIQVPPLRKRRDDIPILIDYFLKKYSLIYKKELKGFDERSIEILNSWSFPGNVRELENIIEYCVIKTKNKHEICVCNLPQNLREKYPCNSTSKENVNLTINSTNLINILNDCRWNKTLAAKKLGIDRTTLWRRLKSLGID